MTVYLDIVFFENICMDYIILFATGLISKAKIKQLRLILSSILGSVYAVVSYITQAIGYSSIIVKIFLSIAMVYIAFNSQNIKTAFKQLIVFYLTSFLFGGCAFSLLYFISPEKIFFKNGKLVGTYPIKIAFLGAIVGFILVNVAFKIVKRKIAKKDMFCNIEINYKHKRCNVRAMIDTGNLLKDPITKSPVIVVEANALTNIIPKDILHNLQKIILGEYEEIDTNYISKFRVIPFSSIGKQNGILLGFKVDNVIINFEEKKIKNEKVVIGIYDKCLTKNKEYTALVGLDLLEGDDSENEHFANIKR